MRHTIELNPHFPCVLTLGLIREQMEDFDESAAAFQRISARRMSSDACSARSNVSAVWQTRQGAGSAPGALRFVG